MYQEAPAFSQARSPVIQHIVFPTDPHAVSVYLRVQAIDHSCTSTTTNVPLFDRRSVFIQERTAVSFDALFNQLPEAYWLAYTQAQGFRFSSVISGVGEIQLWRRYADGRDEVVATQDFDTAAAGAEAVEIEFTVPAPPRREDEAGLLYVKIGARRGPVVLIKGEWSALGVMPKQVRIIAGYCTFNRERHVVENVKTVLAASEIRGSLARLIVVDQGRSSALAETLATLAEQPGGDVLSVIQQDNFGGTGGFARIMLEALGTDGATHVLLMDDDARIETESIFRTAAFLSLTRNAAIGGQMLDLFRPDVVIETGAWFRPEQMSIQRHGSSLTTTPRDLFNSFASVRRTEYNAWWFFAVPLSVVRTLGLPLPLFIRYDDVEYGMRLARNGIPTVSLPGVAVWHEPFYAKNSTWLTFYEMRNKLILSEVYYHISGRDLAGYFLYSTMRDLLSYRYDNAALDCAAVEQWLRGPEAIAEHPQDRHAGLFEADRLVRRRRIPAADTKSAVADCSTLEQLKAFIEPPRGRAFWRAGIRAVARGLIGRRRRSKGAAVPALPQIAQSCRIWWAVQAYPEVAFRPEPTLVAISGDETCSALAHSATAFRQLLPRVLIAYARLRWGTDACVASWRDGIRMFHSELFWKQYLGINSQSAIPRGSTSVADFARHVAAPSLSAPLPPACQPVD